MFLLDAGIWIASGSPKDSSYATATRLVRQPPAPLAALDLTAYEVVNVVGAREAQPEAARTLIRVMRRRCGDRIFAVDAELLDSALEILAEHQLTAYDAAYVAAARRSGAQLVSLDIRDLVSKGLAVMPDAAV